MSLSADLTTHDIVAHNYAHDSANKIHDDSFAEKYGFKGGLVPGAADYAYLCHAVHGVFGDEWLRGGMMEAKFIKPIYHGEVAQAQARATEDPNRLTLALVDPRGETCSVGTASRSSDEAPPRLADYPHHPMPAAGSLPEPTVETFPAGLVLGSYQERYDAEAAAAEGEALFVENLYASDGAPIWHPGVCLHLANIILRDNVNLGPWVHTGSRVHYFDAPRDGETLYLRGSVLDTYIKRGHVVTDCDLAMFAGEGDAARALVRIKHTAIIRLSMVA